MSSLEYYTKPGKDAEETSHFHYQSLVKLPGGVAKLAGVGGWDDAWNLDATDIPQQVARAIANVDSVLQGAGYRGWEDVYLVRAYIVNLDQAETGGAAAGAYAEQIKKRIPQHKPVLTGIGVQSLAFPGMLIELEAEAVSQA